VAKSPDELRKIIIYEVKESEGRIRIDDIIDKYDQPREPVKRVLEELCTYDKSSKTYELKPFNK